MQTTVIINIFNICNSCRQIVSGICEGADGYEALSAIRYHLYNNVKSTHLVVIVFVKLQAVACNFTKTITPPWVFFMFFKLYK